MPPQLSLQPTDAMEHSIVERQQNAVTVPVMHYPRRGRRLRHAVPVSATAVLATTGLGFCTRSISLSGCFALAPGRRQGSSSSSGSQADTAGLATTQVPAATFSSTATAGGQLVAILVGGVVAGKLAGRQHGRAAVLAERSLARVACRAADKEESEVAEADTPNDQAEVTDAAEDTEESVKQEEPEIAQAEEKTKKKKAEKWTCSACGAKNFPQVSDCHKCGNHRPSKAEEALLAEKEAANGDIKKIMDDFLRAQADLQNYRRKHTESMSRAEELGKQDTLKDLVPFSEDIAAALVKPENMTDREAALFESYSLLFRKIDDAYTKFGVEPTDTKVGDKLDPLLHLKVEEREAPGDESPGTILEVVKQGCKCEGKILIPSEVAIVAFPEVEEAQAETGDEDAGDDEEMAQDDAADTDAEAQDEEGTPATEESKEDEAKTDK